MATAAIDIAVETNSAALVISNAAQTVPLNTATFFDAAKFTHDATAFSIAVDAATSWIEIQATLAWSARTLDGAWRQVVRMWIETSVDGGTTWTIIAQLEGAATGVRAGTDREELGSITFMPLLLAAAEDQEYRMRVQRVLGNTDVQVKALQARLMIKDVVAEHFPP